MKNLLRAAFLTMPITGPFPTGMLAKDLPFVAKTETIRGTITTVDVAKKLLILKNADGVFFDFQIQPNTSIEVGTQKVKLEDLANQMGKEAAVTFRMLLHWRCCVED